MSDVRKCIRHILHDTHTHDAIVAYIDIYWAISAMDINNHTIQLQKNFKILVHQLVIGESIADHLISAEILCPEDHGEICAQITKEQKNRLLLTKLMHKDADAFTCFLSVLKDDICYEKLARRIERTEVTNEDKIWLQIGRYLSNLCFTYL